MTSELGRRVWFTIGALLVYRLGTYVPLPGIDQTALAQLFHSQGSGLHGFGGAVQRLALFALGLMPYLSAAILLQIVSIVAPALRALPRQGERGRRKLGVYTLGLTLALAALQAFGIAVALEGVGGLVVDPGWPFRITAALSLTGGTVFLVWLSDQITARGVGNGLALILAIGIIVELPGTIAETLELGRRGIMSTNLILGMSVLAAALTGLVVFMELAQRRIPVAFPRRQVGMIGGQSHLTFKLNPAGVIPAIVAAWLIAQFVVLVAFIAGPDSIRSGLASGLGQGRPLYVVCYALGIVLCALLYTAFVLDPDEIADGLAKRGAAIPEVAPGEPTAAHIDTAISRIVPLGIAYLLLVCLVPEFIIRYEHVPFYLGGTSLLIVVGALLDLGVQLKKSTLVTGGRHP
jgi:preprotein translocase subunit SecY